MVHKSSLKLTEDKIIHKNGPLKPAILRHKDSNTPQPWGRRHVLEKWLHRHCYRGVMFLEKFVEDANEACVAWVQEIVYI